MSQQNDDKIEVYNDDDNNDDVDKDEDASVLYV